MWCCDASTFTEHENHQTSNLNNTSGPLYSADLRKSGISCAHLRLFLNLFFCCFREDLEQSPIPRSLPSPQYSTTYTHGKQRVAAEKIFNPPVGSLPIDFFLNVFFCGSLGVSENRPKPTFLPNRPSQAYLRPQQLPHPREAEGSCGEARIILC